MEGFLGRQKYLTESSNQNMLNHCIMKFVLWPITGNLQYTIILFSIKNYVARVKNKTRLSRTTKFVWNC